MLSLLLAIIISTCNTSRVVADQILPSFGFGANGGGYQSNPTPTQGYDSRFNPSGPRMFYPSYTYYATRPGYINNPKDSYVPEGMIPFGPPTHFSTWRSSAGRQKILDPSCDVEFENPDASAFFQSLCASTTPFQPQYNQARHRPIFAITETYSFFPDTKSTQHKSFGNTTVDSNSPLSSNKTSIPLNFGKETEVLKFSGEDESRIMNERDLKFTYIGEMPSLSVRDVPDDMNQRSSSNRIPFYPLFPDRTSHQRSASPPPILVSPYRFRDNLLSQSFNTGNYHQSSLSTLLQNPPSSSPFSNNYYSNPINPITYPYSNIYHPTSPTQFSSISPQFSGMGTATPVLFRSDALPVNPPRPPNPTTKDGYLIFDVEPLKSFQPMGDPTSRPVNIIQPGKAFHSVSNNEFAQLKNYISSGDGRIIPNARTYSQIYTEGKDSSQVQNSNNANFVDYARRLMMNSYGPEEMRQLVGRLLTLRRGTDIHSR